VNNIIESQVLVSFYEVIIGLVVTAILFWLIKDRPVQFVQLFSIQIALIAVAFLLIWYETTDTLIARFAIILIFSSLLLSIVTLFIGKNKGK